MAYTSSISKFINTIGKVQRNYLYYVHIQLPAAMTTGSSNDIVSNLNFFAQTVNLPSREIEVSEWRHAGRIRHMPTYCLYPPTQFTFICDEGMRAKKMLDAWQSNIIEPGYNYVNYYDDFVGSCTVISMSTEGQATYMVKFNEFFPTRVDEINFDGTTNNAYATVEAEFRFKDWHSADISVNLPQGVQSFIADLTDIEIPGETSQLLSGFNVPALSDIKNEIKQADKALNILIEEAFTFFNFEGLF